MHDVAHLTTTTRETPWDVLRVLAVVLQEWFDRPVANWLLRIVVAVALAGAAAMTYAAAWQRWWPACPRGGFDSDACLRLQSHEYDFQFPGDPWMPIGQAAELYGGALLALAVAAALLPTVLPPDRPRRHTGVGVRWRRFATLVAVVPAVSLALLGVYTLRSGQAGELVSMPGVGLVFVVWCLAWPACLTALAAAAPGVRPKRALPVAVLLGFATPIPAALLFGPVFAGYVSYDTAPWTEAASAPLLLAAAVAVLFVAPRSGQNAQPGFATSLRTVRSPL
ncbi:hypothetical protein GCM10023350_36970 [Nocardioides endophyticus]|uniref:ABC transporter permease n=1 Tax=Nocardioides endophyticus TaxID=1353775 RepID=A0ABP8Z7H2_9ACTN